MDTCKNGAQDAERLLFPCVVSCCEPDILAIINCVRSLGFFAAEVLGCLECRPSAGRLQTVYACLLLNEVRAIDNLLTNQVFGLNEIMNEVQFFGSQVLTINDAVNNPLFGLEAIGNQVADIGNRLPTMDVAAALPAAPAAAGTNVIFVGGRGGAGGTALTSGPLFAVDGARFLRLRVVNNNPAAATVRVTVFRCDRWRQEKIFGGTLAVGPLGAGEYAVALGSGADAAGVVQAVITGVVPGLYPAAVQTTAAGEVLANTLLPSSAFAPLAGDGLEEYE